MHIHPFDFIENSGNAECGAAVDLWWDPGIVMFHGATASEDVDVLFIMDGPFDIDYTGNVERV